MDVDGALIVTLGLTKDRHEELLVVWQDRVEKHDLGKIASIGAAVWGAGRGVESMPIGSVASVETKREGLYSRLEFYGSGNSISFRHTGLDASKIREQVMSLKQEATLCLRLGGRKTRRPSGAPARGRRA